jgi:NAD-dependent SIR2 family protein deacetylase
MPKACSQCGFAEHKEKKEKTNEPKTCKTCGQEYDSLLKHKKDVKHLKLDNIKKNLATLNDDAVAFIEKLLVVSTEQTGEEKL